MGPREHFIHKLSIAVVVFGILLMSSNMIFGQSAAQQPVGVPDDWSHHHLVFSDPGTAADALAAGRFNQWYRVVTDKRYIIQQRKRRHIPPPPIEKRPLHRDWSMNMGAISASQTGTVSSNPATGGTVTVGGQVLTASAPATATQTGTFSGVPTTASAPIVITNTTDGSNTLTVTTNATGSHATGTFSKSPAANSSISITSGTNTLAMTTNATASNVTGTFSTPPTTTTSISITSGSNTLALTTSATTASFPLTFTGNANTTGTITIVYSGGTSSNTLVMTAGTSNTCSSSTAGTFTANVTNSTTRATNFLTAINMCPAAIGVTAARTTTKVTLTAILPGNFLTVTNSLTNTSGAITAGGNGTNTCGSSTAGKFATSNSTTTLASNLSAAIAACPAAAGVSAVSSTNTVTVTDTTPGSLSTSAFSDGATNNTGIFSWGTVNDGTDGSNTCSSSTAGTFATSSSTTTLASNLAAAINLCPTAAAVTATSSTNAVVATDTTLGTGTTFSVTDANVSGIYVWSGVTAGTNGSTSCTGNTTATYAYSATLSTLATNLKTAINDCTASTTGVTAATSGVSSVTLTANTKGTNGNTITLSPSTSGYFEWAGTALAGGSDGTTSGTTFAYWSVNAAVSNLQLATNISTAINKNTTLQAIGGVTATPSLSGANGLVTLVANSAGTSGNSIALAASLTGFGWTGSPLSGGNVGGGTVGAGIYPAKYEFYASSANCDDASFPDYVIYNTGLAGSAVQPTIVAYDNLYSGCPTSSVPVPNVYWQYYTGGTIKTNPVLSEDGTQVAFVQSNSSNQAQLVMLKWARGLAVTTPTSVTAANYSSCTAPCMTVITFDTTGTGIPNDTYSSPFYDYNDDAMYVGEDNGYMHKFSPVFFGTPAEVIGTGWPIQASVAPLSSPVYDYGSTLVFVGAATGANGSSARMHSITSTGTATIIASGSMGAAGGAYMYADAPLVDPSAEMVYAFTNDDIAGTSAAVWQIPAGFTAGQIGTEAAVGQGSTANPMYIGAFDNIYNSNSGPVGNLYVVGRAATSQEPALWRIPINTTMGTPVEIGALTSAATNGSPITEFYNVSSSIDYIFLSVQASASPSGCGGAGCVMSFTVTSALGSGATPTATLAEAGGTSGIIVDNDVSSGTLAGASQIYFSPLGSQSCAGNAVGQGVGTGGCAIQASQSGLN